jgi:NAD-dependent deacetylase
VYDIGYKPIKLGDTCEMGSQLRPAVVWFGEAVPKIVEAQKVVQECDIFIIIGTSMQVYPAAGLIEEAPDHVPIYVIDPNLSHISTSKKYTFINKSATEGVDLLVKQYL